jgi:hypothetical protein
MMSRYRRDDSSSDTLIYLVQDAYDVFSERLFGDEGDRAVLLMDDILLTGYDDDDGDFLVRAAAYYSDRPSELHDTQAERWMDFTDRVRDHPEESPPLTEIFGGREFYLPSRCLAPKLPRRHHPLARQPTRPTGRRLRRRTGPAVILR